ncbi:ABC transporter permease [Actinokineospora xionganensis]|uniref:Transport permease protein n=1 Tax=Actinokineospora xionganensis TaxID=2684470 RepID=A0ABR7L4Y3_9PSEU|nr:ABC transporter permease [Actinokineospora xionganensis]MBC6447456.1 ABC transporter permease [Actinokineospora xionganensis]
MNEVLTDWRALIWRHLLHLKRMPDKLISATVLPMVFVVLFGVLFGSAISIPNGGYQEFIMAGIFTQVMITAVPNTAIGTIEDLNNGLTDRFRSLPMSPSAVLVGRTVGDTALRAVTCVAMTAVGYAIGWRLHGGVLEAIAGFGLLLLFGFTMAWVGALLGMRVRSPEAASSLPSVLLMPLMFTSSAYIPLGGLPGWLRAIAEWNPLSAVAGACRQLWGNPAAAGDSFAARNPVPMALLWLAVILALVVPAAVRRYRSVVPA